VVIEPVEPRPRRVSHLCRHRAAVSPGCHGTTMPSPSPLHGRADAGPDLRAGPGTVPGSGPRAQGRAIPAAWAMEADRGQAAVDEDGDRLGGQPRSALSEGREPGRKAPAGTRRASDRGLAGRPQGGAAACG
jgi:hypothetical protein